MRKLYSGFPTRSDTNVAVKPLRLTRGLKFRILKVKGLYCLCSENKVADQQKADFLITGLIVKRETTWKGGHLGLI